MDTNFNYVHVSASERLEEFTKEKLNKLKERFDFIVSADVYFKTENSSIKEEGRIAEIQLSVPGPQIFASANQENFDMAVNKTISELKTQLQKKKEKMQTHH
ncbi:MULTISPECIES: ribosome hibernation-promoting factor, HPF/YfiA family [Mesonia]|uniref:Ribosome hibernation promoting factor n=1 Tax=Mesonia oceanica TaxID=2687242 RepID=A0AC61Y4W1_9FLAO|nr:MULTISPECIES: ribosome-associated translation inhibitor RaiA [Mesonia]MAN26583.1 ribosomal subunit interface protein [Mesonia sp.]MAQ40851.1 ribosomal subunit interface protein [Mesonia sp.]MBJ97772.1 ribosomal subunit interface protein [Flavobacteriaceae bacterium]VVU99480.1 Ribosome hibernation promoting factor [Mesonia oceanica]|tara:strand:- start:1397 stop:1702 length:306 start_codon:yes stop_codon:yes gene_type:complete